jgi:predicted enzyme related to lactoylglutathione lyase
MVLTVWPRGLIWWCAVDFQKLRNWPSPPLSKSPQHLGDSMKRVTGIGGIFFKAKDPAALQAWYKRHLGIDVQDWGGTVFNWADGDGKPVAGSTVWTIGAADGDMFATSTVPFMVNYRVEDLHALVKVLREEGCNVLDKVDDSEYGKFAWVIDPEGNKVELWQPPVGQ